VKKEPKSVWRVLENLIIDSYYLRQSGIPSAQEDAAPSPHGQLRLPRPPGFLTPFLPEIDPAMGSIKAVQQSSASLTSNLGFIPKPQQLLLPSTPQSALPPTSPAKPSNRVPK